MIRIAVADDHPVFRAGVRQILADEPTITISGEASTGAELRALVEQLEIDVVLLDITMPDTLFPGILNELRARRPAARVLILSMHAEEEFAIRALRAGAGGYLSKDRSPEELVIAIKKVAGGGKYVTASLAEKMGDMLGNGFVMAPHERLSDREYQVLCLLGAGRSVTQVAGELRLSPKTIGTHRTRILGKMRLRTNAELIRYVVEHGLIS